MFFQRIYAVCNIGMCYVCFIIERFCLSLYIVIIYLSYCLKLYFCCVLFCYIFVHQVILNMLMCSFSLLN